MNAPPSLALQEEILLLALRDREGTFAPCSHLPYALAGALLAELLLAGRIRVDEADRKRRVQVMDPKPLGEPLLDEALDRIATARRPATLSAWVDRLTRFSRLKHRVAEGLCRRGVLRLSQKEILLLFKKRIYPEVDSRPERELRDRLRGVVAAEVRDVGERTVTLLSLLKSAQLLELVMHRKELKPRRARVESLVAGEPVGKAVAEAVQAAEAATAAACGVAVTVAC